MLRRIIVIFCGLLCIYLAPAQAQETAPPAAAVRQPIPSAPRHGALFKISRADHTLFLFGTIHVGRPDFFPFEANVAEALAKASKIALELDPADSQSLLQAMRQHGWYPADAAPGARIGKPLGRAIATI